MISRRRLLGAAACATGTFLPLRVFAQQGSPAVTHSDLRGLRLIEGAGANIIALQGPEGALMIDGGLAARADETRRVVFGSTGASRVHTLINTHWHPEQTGANESVGQSGGVIFAHENTQRYLQSRVYRSAVLDELLEPLAAAGIPNQITRGDGSFDFGSATIEYGYLPQAHTDGDLFVRFPELNVLVAGDVVASDRWPLLDYLNGAWYGGRVRALQRLAELVDAGTIVVGAKGQPLNGNDIVRLRDIYLELFETLIDYMNRGYGPEDAAANTPLARYDSEFRDADEFVYGAYRSMLIAYVPE